MGNFCLVAYRGVPTAAEMLGETQLKGYIVLDSNTGLYGVGSVVHLVHLVHSSIWSIRTFGPFVHSSIRRFIHSVHWSIHSAFHCGIRGGSHSRDVETSEVVKPEEAFKTGERESRRAYVVNIHCWVREF